MVPDLENLFQKLGWMGRERFVFPTHTGLLPHGRALGPRSLVWQVAIFVVCFGALGLITPTTADGRRAGHTAVLGQPEISVLASDEQRTVVRLLLPAVAGAGRLGRASIRAWPCGRLPAGPASKASRTCRPSGCCRWRCPRARPCPVRVLGVSWWKEPTDGRLRPGVPGAGRNACGAAGRAHPGRRGGPVRRRRHPARDHPRVQPPAHGHRAREPGPGRGRGLRPEVWRRSARRRPQPGPAAAPGRRGPGAGPGRSARPQARTPPALCSPPPPTG